MRPFWRGRAAGVGGGTRAGLGDVARSGAGYPPRQGVSGVRSRAARRAGARGGWGGDLLVGGVAEGLEGAWLDAGEGGPRLLPRLAHLHHLRARPA